MKIKVISNQLSAVSKNDEGAISNQLSVISKKEFRNPNSEIRIPKSSFTLIELIVVAGIALMLLKFSLPMLSKVAKGSGVKRSALTFASNMKLARLQAISKRQKVAVVMLTGMNASKYEGSAIVPAASGSDFFYRTDDENFLEKKNMTLNFVNQGIINSAYRIGIVDENQDSDAQGKYTLKSAVTLTDAEGLVDTWITDWIYSMDGTGFATPTGNSVKNVGVIRCLYPTSNKQDAGKWKNSKFHAFGHAKAFVFDKNGTLQGGEAKLGFYEGFYDKINGGFQVTQMAGDTANVDTIRINQYTGKLSHGD